MNDEIMELKKRFDEKQAIKKKNEQIINDTMKLNKVNSKTVKGLIYILDSLYKEMLNEGYKYDLLRLGAVKMSSDVFKEILKNMPEDITLTEYLETTMNNKGENELCQE